MKRLKNIFKFIILISISPFLEAKGGIDYNWMIDTINHQKILTQQILKDYAFSGMGNSFKNSTENLNKYLNEYEKELSELQRLLSDDEATEYLSEVTTIWIPIKKIFDAPAEKSKVEDLQKKGDKILEIMSKLMKIVIAKASNSSKDENMKDKNVIVSISGYQNVIIERMGALYMLKTWGIDDPKFNFKMKESITFFKNSLYKMLNSKHTTDSNRVVIEKVMKNFKFFEIMNRSKTKFIPTLIYDKTEKIHADITKITKAYIEEDK